MEQEIDFVNVLRFGLKANLMTIPKICCGLLEKTIESNGVFSIEDTPYLGDFLDTIVLHRLGMRILLGHQVTIHDDAYDTNNSKTEFHGILEDNCDFERYISQSVEDAKDVCKEYFYGLVPNVNINDKRRKYQCTFVPETLHHMIFELVKNSMRATIEHCFDHLYSSSSSSSSSNENIRKKHSTSEILRQISNNTDNIRTKIENEFLASADATKENEANGGGKNTSKEKLKNHYYDINIIITDDLDNGDVTVKVQDSGGGMTKHTSEKVFLYGYTTAFGQNRDNHSNININNIDQNSSRHNDYRMKDGYDTYSAFMYSDASFMDNSEEENARRQKSMQMNDGFDDINDNNNSIGDDSSSSSSISGNGDSISNSSSGSNIEEEDISKQLEILQSTIETSEEEVDTSWRGGKSQKWSDLVEFVSQEKYAKIDRAMLGAVKDAPMFGLGYGLPCVRVYAKYFGGSCKLYSIDGHGTDAYLHCPNLALLEGFKV